MPIASVTIERIKLKDLPALAAAAVDGAAPGTFIPITKHRAAAHQKNPNAKPDDVALLLAKAGEQNVGYFGLMPMMLQQEGQLHKAHWLTTWAVAPGYLGKGLGSQLMEAALALNVDLAIVGSKPARRVSAKYGFHEVPALHYVQIDLGLAGRYNPLSLLLRLVRKVLSWVKIRLNIERVDRALVRLFDALFAPLMRPILTSILLGRVGRSARKIHLTPIQQVSVTPAESVPGTRFYRSIAVINWMLAHPWVLPAGLSESELLDYGFTDARPGFAISGWQVKEATGAELGFVCFQTSRIRDKQVIKVLDHQFAAGTTEGMLLALALQHAHRARADLIEGSAELAAPLGTGLLARLVVQHKQRTCQVHPRAADSPMGRAWPQLEQDYCDGDMAFT